MKYSGIEWVGQIPESWDMRRLGFCLDEISVKNNPIKTTQVLSLVKDIGVLPYEEKGDKGNKAKEDVREYHLAYPNTIVLNCMNILIGSVGISNYFGCVSPVYYVFKETSDSDLRFVNYLFNTREFQKELRKYANGILEIRLRVSADDIFKRKVPLPDKSEQIRISDFLDRKCSEIDSLRADIEAEIEIIEKYKSSKISEVFSWYSDRYNHIETKLSRISKLITKQTGFDYATYIKPALVSQETDSTYPFIQTKNFKSNYFDFETDYYIPIEVANKFPRIVLDNKCLLFSISGASIGNVAVFPATRKAFLGGAICKVDLMDNNMCEYVKCWALSPTTQQYIDINIYASAQGNITVQNVRDIKIPIFDNSINMEITSKINNIINEVDIIVSEKHRQMDLLKEYKKSLIYEYVTGKKEVPNE